MADDDSTDIAPAVPEAPPIAATNPKTITAKAIVDAWRNEHFNTVPTGIWDAYSKAETHLVAAIAAAL